MVFGINPFGVPTSGGISHAKAWTPNKPIGYRQVIKSKIKNRVLFLLTFCLVQLQPLRSFAQHDQENLDAFLQTYIGFREKDFAKMQQGRVVAKLLDTDVGREIAVFGIVRIDMPKGAFIAMFPDRALIIESALAIESGEFSMPPTIADVRGLTLDKDDAEAIRHCKIGHCDIKLSAAAIERFQKKEPWNQPDGQNAVLTEFKQMLVEYVAAYQKGGNEAMAVYHDKKEPLHLVSEFRDMLQESPYLYKYRPQLHAYLENYPNATLPNSRRLIFWAKDDLGTKRKVIALTQILIYQPVEHKIADFLIASKQLYASHYFEAAFGITALADNPDSAGENFYLIYLVRSRIDALRNKFVHLLKGKIQGAVRKRFEEKLQQVKQTAETRYHQKKSPD